MFLLPPFLHGVALLRQHCGGVDHSGNLSRQAVRRDDERGRDPAAAAGSIALSFAVPGIPLRLSRLPRLPSLGLPVQGLHQALRDPRHLQDAATLRRTSPQRSSSRDSTPATAREAASRSAADERRRQLGHGAAHVPFWKSSGMAPARTREVGLEVDRHAAVAVSVAVNVSVTSYDSAFGPIWVVPQSM